MYEVAVGGYVRGDNCFEMLSVHSSRMDANVTAVEGPEWGRSAPGARGDSSSRTGGRWPVAKNENSGSDLDSYSKLSLELSS